MPASEAFPACRASSACKARANEKKNDSPNPRCGSEAAGWSRQCHWPVFNDQGGSISLRLPEVTWGTIFAGFYESPAINWATPIDMCPLVLVAGEQLARRRRKPLRVGRRPAAPVHRLGRRGRAPHLS